MELITVNALCTRLVPLPTIESDAELTLTILKSSGGTLSGGTFTYLNGIQWKLTFTPTTLDEIYAVEVRDAENIVIFSQSYKAKGVVYDGEVGPGGSLEVGVNTWVTGQEAEDYFITRFGIGTLWSALSDADKIAALITAHSQLATCNLFEFPSDITANMKKAQYEMTLFIVKHQADMDTRLGLQAQGVVTAGIAQETYDKNVIGEISLPPMVKALLKDYETDSPVHVVNLERDEEEDVL